MRKKHRKSNARALRANRGGKSTVLTAPVSSTTSTTTTALAVPTVPVGAADEQIPLTTRITPHPRISRWNPVMGQIALTWDQIQVILQSAERGYTEQYADLTRRMLKSDDHLFSVYTTYAAAIAGARREVKPKTLGVPAGLDIIAKTQAEACEEMLESLPNIGRSIAQLVDADFTGFAVLEIQWGIRGNMVVPIKLIWVHPDRFRWTDDFRLYLWDRGAGAARAQELGIQPKDGIVGLPLFKDHYIVHIPQTMLDYPTSSGIFQACVRPWYTKSWAIKFNLAGAEAAGNARMLGKLREGATEQEEDELYQGLSSLSADGVGIVRGESSIEVLDVKAEGEGGVWDSLIKRCDAAMSKAVLGSTLNVEIGDTGGNRAAAESQADITIGPRWARSCQSIAETLENFLFRPFLEANKVLWGGHVFVPNLHLHIAEDKPQIGSDLIDLGIVSVDEIRRSNGLSPWGPERGGDLTPAEWKVKFGGAVDPSQDPATQEQTPAAIEIAAGSSWIDTDDGHRLEVTGMDDTRVYFKDLDAPNPERQWSWARRSFLERCRINQLDVPATDRAVQNT